MIDTHCHLNLLGDKVAEIIARAKEAGVKKLITISTSLACAPVLQQICDDYDDIYCTIGVHPCDVKDAVVSVEAIKALCNHPQVVGIGETGLDYYRPPYDAVLQRQSFAIHIEAANQLRLPIVVHARSAEEDTLYHIKSVQSRGVLHCFEGSYEMAVKAIDRGFCISFSGILTFQNAQNLQEVAKKLPLDCMVIETDSPYLSPKPKRDVKPNEPAFVQYVAHKLAEIKGVSYEEIDAITTRNAEALFGL